MTDPHAQLRHALAWSHANQQALVMVATADLEALLAERTRLRARIHEVAQEWDNRCKRVQSERDSLREQRAWGMQRLREGGDRYANWSKVAVAMGIAEELERAYEVIRLCGGYLEKIGEGDA